MDAVILAGGAGNRMESSCPKAIVEAKGKPIIAWQLDYLLGSENIEKIVLALGFGAEEIIAFVEKNYPQERIAFSVEKEPLGTAGALKNALRETKSDFVLAFNCDDLADISLQELGKARENTICVAHPRLPFGRVLEKKGFAVFEEKPLLQEWVSCGWYLFKKAGLLKFLPEKGSLEYDVFPKLKMKMYCHKGFWKALNTKKDILEFEAASLPAALESNSKQNA